MRTTLWKGMWHWLSVWGGVLACWKYRWQVFHHGSMESIAAWDSLVTVSVCDAGAEAEWRKETMIVGMVLLSAWRCGSCWRWWTRKPEWTQDLGDGSEFLKPPGLPTAGFYSEECMFSVFKTSALGFLLLAETSSQSPQGWTVERGVITGNLKR